MCSILPGTRVWQGRLMEAPGAIGHNKVFNQCIRDICKCRFGWKGWEVRRGKLYYN